MILATPSQFLMPRLRLRNSLPPRSPMNQRLTRPIKVLPTLQQAARLLPLPPSLLLRRRKLLLQPRFLLQPRLLRHPGLSLQPKLLLSPKLLLHLDEFKPLNPRNAGCRCNIHFKFLRDYFILLNSNKPRFMLDQFKPSPRVYFLVYYTCRSLLLSTIQAFDSRVTR